MGRDQRIELIWKGSIQEEEQYRITDREVSCLALKEIK